MKSSPVQQKPTASVAPRSLLLPTRGDVRTVSPVENRRYVGPAKRQDVAVRVLRHQPLFTKCSFGMGQAPGIILKPSCSHRPENETANVR